MASLIASGGATRMAIFAACGALTGTVAAACTLYRIGEFHGIAIGGYCFGVQPMPSSACGGIDGAVYVFPGLAFGIVFGPLLYFCRRLSAIGAGAYVLAAFAANLVAVSICISLMHPIGDLLPFDNFVLDVAVSGVVAGAVGGGLLGAALAAFDGAVQRALSIAVAAGLGVLTPLVIMFDQPGIFAFFMIWQSGYAAAVAASLPRRQRGA
jgi:hypothetical protein